LLKVLSFRISNNIIGINRKGVDSVADKELFKPGEIVPDSGQAEIRGPRGGETRYGERTVTKGEPFPPTPEPGLTYKIVDQTKHRKK